ncbi:MAG: T9SS type A sorting domain-containing protein [Ignavibacteria bacterium]
MKFLYIYITYIILIFGNLSAQSPEYLKGFPKDLDSYYQPMLYGATPIIANFDNQGDKEIAFALKKPQHIKIYILKSDGSDLAGWPVTIVPAYTWPAIAAGDVNNDGFLDVVLRDNDSLFVFNNDGTAMSGFPVFYKDEKLNHVTLYDLNNNGYLEIIIKGSNYVNIFDHNGNQLTGWPKRLPGYPADRVLSPPVSVADLDNDNYAEIIVNSSQCVSGIICDSSYINIFRHDGTNFPRWPLKIDSGYVFFSQPATIYNDSMNDSTFLYINSAYYFTNSDSVRTKNSKYTIGGNLISNYFSTTVTSESSSIALSNDNNNFYQAFGAEPSPLFLFDKNNLPMNNWPVFSNGYYYNSPLIVKMNNDLIITSHLRYIDFSLKGFVNFFNINGSQLSWSPLRPYGVVSAAGVYGDINNDNQLDYFIFTLLDTNNVSHPILNGWTFPGVTYDQKNMYWPMYGHDRYRTNQYGFIPPDEPVGILPTSNIVPDKFELHQNYPNPFNPITNIKFDIKQSSDVRLNIYDALGRKISKLINEKLQSGTYNAVFDGSNFSSGVYFYKLETEGFVETRRMILLK